MFRDYNKRCKELKGAELDAFQLKVCDLIIAGCNEVPKYKDIRMYFKQYPKAHREVYGKLYHEYKKRIGIENTYYNNIRRSPQTHCKYCNIIMIIDTESGNMVCSQCGLIDPFYYTVAHISDSNHNRVNQIHTYKKEDHLNKCLDECPEMPLYIRNEIIKLFHAIKEPLFKIYKPSRNNFLNYPYVIRKLLQISDHCEYMKYFNVLKSLKRIRQHDALWYKLCKRRDLQYFPTIQRRRIDSPNYNWIWIPKHKFNND